MTTYTLTGDGQTYASSISPVYDVLFRFWRCQDANGNDFNVTDPTGSTFTVSGGYTPNYVTIPTFKLLFSPAEEVAIYASVDPQVVRFVALVDDPKTMALDLNLPAVIERVTYLSTMPASDPPGALPISEARLAQVLSGVLQ